MGFEIPAKVTRDIQEFAHAERISDDEALVRLIASGLKATKRKSQSVAPLSDEETARLEGFGKTFGLLQDVPDDVIDRMAGTIRRMKREGLPSRG